MATKDLTPKFNLKSADKELEIPDLLQDIGTRVGGMSMFSDSFKRGAGDLVFGQDSRGIWLGSSDFSTAPFSVSMAGALVATSATITGFIEDGGAAADVNANVTTISGGKITADSITATQISANAITADKIAALAIVSGKIAASAVTADKISVSSLSAISADIGSVTAGTITGATVRTASSGARFEISGSKGASYNSSGTELTRLDGSGLGLFGTAGNIIQFKDSATGTLRGEQGYNSGLSGMYFSAANNMIINGDDQLYLLADNDINIDTDGNKVYILDTLNMNSHDIESVTTIKADKGEFTNGATIVYDLKLKSGADRFVFQDSSGNEQLSLRPNGSSSELRMNGFSLQLTSSKTAVLPTSMGYRELYSAESPEVWFFDFIDSKDKIDPLFDEVTSGEYKFIKVDDGGYQVWRRRKDHDGKRFNQVTEKDFLANEKFLRLARKC